MPANEIYAYRQFEVRATMMGISAFSMHAARPCVYHTLTPCSKNATPRQSCRVKTLDLRYLGIYMPSSTNAAKNYWQSATVDFGAGEQEDYGTFSAAIDSCSTPRCRDFCSFMIHDGQFRGSKYAADNVPRFPAELGWAGAAAGIRGKARRRRCRLMAGRHYFPARHRPPAQLLDEAPESP